MDYLSWMKKALIKIRSYSSDTVFEVKELFDPLEWKGLQHGEKTAFGRLFSNEYKSGRIPEIERLERGRDNHSRYRKL